MGQILLSHNDALVDVVADARMTYQVWILMRVICADPGLVLEFLFRVVRGK